ALRVGRAVVDAEECAVRSAQGPILHRELDAVATPGDRLADQQLVVPVAVEVAGIEKRDAALHGGMDDGLRVRIGRLAVDAGEAHAAKSDLVRAHAVNVLLAFNQTSK